MPSTRALHVLNTLGTAPFRWDDAIAAGVPARTLSALTCAGLLRRPVHGVRVSAEAPDTLDSRAAAAALVLPPGAAVCRTSAAWLLGFDARAPGEHRREPVLECVVPHPGSPLRRPGVRCYVSDVRGDDVTEVRGVPCTTPARTAVDLARWLTPGLALGVLDAMARASAITPIDLLALTTRWKGDRYIAQARRLIGLCDPAAESPGESWLRLRFHDAGFPPPELQIPLTGENGHQIRRLDLGYRQHRYAWEYDGEEFHLGRDAEAADRRRRSEIERRWGWTVVGVGKNLVLGSSMALEYAIGEIVGMQPAISRRRW